jgi:Ser-tRNA(Ala) deacylase AlaX
LTKEAVAKQLEVSCNKIVDDWSWEVVKKPGASGSEPEATPRSVTLRFDEKNTRCVKFVDVDGPCGGTHVPKISEIGKLEISKIVLKKMNCRVSYKLRE